MPVELTCTACAARLRVPGFTPGRAVRCPKCATVFVPAAPPQAAAPNEPPLAELVPEPDAPAPPVAAAPPAVAPPPPVPRAQPVAPPANPFEFDKKPEPERTASAPKNAKIVGAPNAKSPPRTLPVAPKAQAPDAAGAPAPKATEKSKDKPKTQPKGAKARDREPVARPINPAVLVGGLAFLVLGAAVLVGVLIFGRDDKNDQAKRDPAPVAKEKVEPRPKPPEPEPKPPEPEPNPPEPEPKPEPKDERIKPPLFPALNPPGPVEPEPEPKPPVGPGPVDPPVKPPARPVADPLFPPVRPVELKPAPLTAARAEVELPGTATDACVGGGGRFWCLLIESEKVVAVFDASAGKVTKLLRTDGGKAVIAAGMDKLVIGYPEAGKLVRYDLLTFEKEKTADAPVKFAKLMMGSASAGPLYVGLTPISLATLDKFRDEPKFAGGRWDESMHYRVSPDGHVLGSWSTRWSPGGLNVATLGDTAVRAFSEHTSVGFVVPAADGTVVTGGGVYGPTGKKLEGPAGFFHRVPAQEGRYYLTVPGGGGAQVNTGMGDTDKPTVVYATGENRALVKLPDVALPVGNEAWAASDFLADKKVLFTIDGQLIAVLAPGARKLVLHKFDLVSELDKSGADYLLVTSRPPAPVPGAAYRYPIAVKSKKGGVTYKLEAGPKGMAVDAAGVLTWSVPAGWAANESVVLTIRDSSGQEIFHTFAVAPAGALAAEVPAGPPPARPDAGPVPLVRAALAPAPLAPTRAADGAEIKLPGTADYTCWAGGGRFVLLRIPAVKQVAVFDVVEGKIAKLLPIPESNAHIAAGNEHLFVLAPTANVIQRWSLLTFEKEVTVPNPVEGKVFKLLVGHATDGPLFLYGPNKALDPLTFREVALAGERAGNIRGTFPSNWRDNGRDDHAIHISADGRVFAWCSLGTSPMGLNSVVLGDTANETKARNKHETGGILVPGPDGTIFSGGGLLTPELQSVGAKKFAYQYWYHVPVPASSERFYLAVPPPDNPLGKAQKAGLYRIGDTEPLLDVTALKGLDVPADHNQNYPKGLQLHERAFFVPEARALVLVRATGDALYVHHADPEAALKKAGTKYLFALGRPPAAVRGARFEYKPDVRTSGTAPKVQLDAGPTGMKVAADGTLTWDVPADCPDALVTVVLTLSDGSGQQAFHTLRVPVTSAKPKAGWPKLSAALPATVEPKPIPPGATTTLVRPAANPHAFGLTKAASGTAIKLPGTVSSACWGGGGRFVVLTVPSAKQVLVFDVVEGKVTQKVALDDPKVHMTATNEYLFVVPAATPKFSKYSLLTGELLEAVQHPGPVTGLRAGHATDGLVFACGSNHAYATGPRQRTLRVSPFETEAQLWDGAPWQAQDVYQMRASADGRTFTWFRLGPTPSATAVVIGDAPNGTKRLKHDGATGVLLPGPTGVLFSSSGLFDRELKPIKEFRAYQKWHLPPVPAAHGPFYVYAPPDPTADGPDKPAPKAFLYLLGHDNPVADLTPLPGLDLPKTYNQTAAGLPFQDRVFAVPDAGALVLLNGALDTLYVHKVPYAGALVTSKALVVHAEPRPPAAVKGERFEYRVPVRAVADKVTLLVTAAPPGMKPAADGALVWDVPADYAGDVARVKLTVTASNGAVQHTQFDIAVLPARPKAVEPKAPSAVAPVPRAVELADEPVAREIVARGGWVRRAAHLPGRPVWAAGIKGPVTIEAARALAQLPHLTELTVFGGAPLRGAAEELARLKGLRALRLQTGALTETHLTALTALDELTELEVSGTLIPDDGFAPLARFKRLRALNLSSNGRLAGPGLAHLAGLTELTELNLDVNDIPEGFAALAGLKKLTRLNAGRGLTATGCAELARLPALTHLDLRSSYRLTAEALKALGGCARLVDLNLAGARTVGPALAAGGPSFAALPALEHLNLQAVPVTAAGLKALSGAKALKWLEVGSTDLGDDWLAGPDLPALERLTAPSVKLTDAGCAHLKRFPKLVAVELTGNALTDAGVETIARLPNLRRAALGYSPVPLTVRSAKALAGVPTLTACTITMEDIDDEHFAALATLPNLEELNVLFAPKVTAKGLKALLGAKRLRAVQVAGPGVDAAFFEGLACGSNLRWLHASGPNFDDRAAAVVVARFPDLEYLGAFGTALTNAGAARFAALDKLVTLHLSGPALTLDGTRAVQELLPRGSVRLLNPR